MIGNLYFGICYKQFTCNTCIYFFQLKFKIIESFIYLSIHINTFINQPTFHIIHSLLKLKTIEHIQHILKLFFIFMLENKCSLFTSIFFSSSCQPSNFLPIIVLSILHYFFISLLPRLFFHIAHSSRSYFVLFFCSSY